MHRFFAAGIFAKIVSIKKDDVKHIKNVLRLKVGDEITVVDEAGQSAICRLTALFADIEFSVVQTLEENNEPKLQVILAQGLGKGEKMDFVVQKAVELGVREIVPLALDRCVTDYQGQRALLKKERWQKIAEQAAKQAKRNVIPTVHDIMSLRELLETFAADLRLVFYEKEEANGLRKILQENREKSKTVLLLIGPEGGLSEEEIKICHDLGLNTVSLGKRILRTETAAVTALSLVMYELGDLGGGYA